MLRSFWAICRLQFITSFRSNVWKVLLLACAVLPFWAIPKTGSSRVVLTLGQRIKRHVSSPFKIDANSNCDGVFAECLCNGITDAIS